MSGGTPPEDRPTVSARLVERIGDIAAADWDACAGFENPFVSHAFLEALEISGSVSARSGWLPRHLVLEDEQGVLVGAVPLYVKGHSQGEYVFDWGWADAFERAGGDYYPKLQAAVPFSPVSGPRLLTRDKGDTGVQAALIAALEAVAQQLNVSSVHATFTTEDEYELFKAAGWITRLGQQFHWHNQSYETFDDFLATLVSRKRKAIRKERRMVAESGLTLQALSGSAIRPEHWNAFYRFYVDTYDRKWGEPYLTRGFFEELQLRMGNNVVLVMAFDGDRPVAGALNIKGSDALYGRNWGSVEDTPFLHFEACYYQAIDYAIAHGLSRVEAGTQGPHKIQRGYLPVPTFSAHYIRHAGFRDAVANFCAEERRAMRFEISALAQHSPYRCES
ncbi:MAG: GNAT family N-acetyltransferase [Alphaproteobacteria bacterium]